MKITIQDAQVILQLADISFSEGIGPDFFPLIKQIDQEFPSLIESLNLLHLKQNYQWTPHP